MDETLPLQKQDSPRCLPSSLLSLVRAGTLDISGFLLTEVLQEEAMSEGNMEGVWTVEI